jgi:hypothetical protein
MMMKNGLFVLLLVLCGAMAGVLSVQAADVSAIPVRIGKLPAARVLYLGNSITLHGPAPAIGWNGNWGMAASVKEKDYVSLLTADLAKAAGTRPEIQVRNIADFEREPVTFDIAKEFKAELAFAPDIVIFAIGENVTELTTDQAKAEYAAAYLKLIETFRQAGKPTIFVRSCFWPNPTKDEIMRNAATVGGAVFVDIAKLGSDETNAARAERKIEHAGVAGHPGDKGMRAIADALFIAIQQQAGLTVKSE